MPALILEEVKRRWWEQGATASFLRPRLKCHRLGGVGYVDSHTGRGCDG